MVSGSSPGGRTLRQARNINLLTAKHSTDDPFFNSLGALAEFFPPPDRFTLSGTEPHPLCLLAAEQLQIHLDHQIEWQHNFGLTEGKEGVIIGKMFGVLVVRNQENELGYLAAFSGKLGGSNHHSGFVPPVFDGLADEGFLNEGMAVLTQMNKELKELEGRKEISQELRIHLLKIARRKHSSALQKQLFDEYYFLNRAGEQKSLNEIFRIASYKNPPSGAGECAGPKLLQYAFQKNMHPLAIAEFWWGLSPKSDFWKHGHYYPCCEEKCKPILAHMLAGIDV